MLASTNSVYHVMYVHTMNTVTYLWRWFEAYNAAEACRYTYTASYIRA
jgi:hypothetical protein